MKKTAIALSFILLSAVLLASCDPGRGRLPDDEALARINELLPLSNEVNDILFGKGLPAVDEAYAEEHTGTAYFPVKDGTGYGTVADIKRAAENVYSLSYMTSVYKSAFEGIDGGDSTIGSVSPRYTEIAGVLKVNVAFKGFDIRTLERVEECRFDSAGDGYFIYACRAVTDDGKRLDVKIYLMNQNGVWLFDSPTY